MSTLKVAQRPVAPVDLDARDRLYRQARLLEYALEGLVAMGTCIEIKPADLRPLVGHVEEMLETIERLAETSAGASPGPG